MRLRTLTLSTSSALLSPATGSILVAAVDCKGIPMVKPRGAQPSAAADQRAEGQ